MARISVIAGALKTSENKNGVHLAAGIIEAGHHRDEQVLAIHPGQLKLVLGDAEVALKMVEPHDALEVHDDPVEGVLKPSVDTRHTVRVAFARSITDDSCQPDEEAQRACAGHA